VQLASEGARVCCADLNESGLEQTLAMIVSHGYSATSHVLDVTIEASWETMIEAIVTAHGRLDVLVNSVGISAAAPLTDMFFTDWQRVLDINLNGAFLATKHALRAMRATGGSIVHVSSASGIKAAAGACAYSVSKAGLCMLSRTAAKECRDQGIPVRVNTVCPGGVKTPMWTTMPFFRELVEKVGSEEAAYQAMAQAVPGGRFSEPTDVVHAILFLASDEARFITGIDLVIDDGYVL
jgi:NAD(P)-dependent dehydrogenase (short-subunit alcohol dehydrogenase family)